MRKRYLTSELRIWQALRLIPLLAGILALSTAAVYFLNVRQAAACAETYREGLSLYEADPAGLEADLAAESTVEDGGQDGLLIIENPIRYYREQVEHAVFSCRTACSGWLACESACFFFPVIWGVFGVLFGSADGRDHMMKLRASRCGKKFYALSHLASAGVICAAGTILYRILFAAGSCFAGAALKKAVPEWEEFLPEEVSGASPAEELCMLGILLLTAMIFAAAGLFLGSVFSSALPGAVGILLYAFLPVSAGAWDVMNSVYDIVYGICPFWGVFRLGDVTAVNGWFRAGILGSALVIPALLYYNIVSRRSGYR